MFYSTTEVGRIFEITNVGVVYWEKKGILTPSFKRGVKRMYSKMDIIDYANTLSKRKVVDVVDYKLIYGE